MFANFVVPYVYPNDSWKANYNQYCKLEHKKLTSAYEDIRYGENIFNEYQIQLVERKMPFVQNILILLADESQKQEWMEDHPKVRIVYHEEFIPKEFLPTFNSQTIELFVPLIKGLSEKFLFANDDMNPLYVTFMEHWFNADGMPLNYFRFRKHDTFPNWYQQVTLNSLRLVYGSGSVPPGTIMTPGHGINAMKKSICLDAFDRYKKEIYRSITRFRENINLNQYIYCYAAELESHSYSNPRRLYYIGSDDEEVLKKLKRDEIHRIVNSMDYLESGRPSYVEVCLNYRGGCDMQSWNTLVKEVLNVGL